MQHQCGTGHMPRSELLPRKRSAGLAQQVEGQFPALPGETVVTGIEALDGRAGLF